MLNNLEQEQQKQQGQEQEQQKQQEGQKTDDQKEVVDKNDPFKNVKVIEGGKIIPEENKRERDFKLSEDIIRGWIA